MQNSSVVVRTRAGFFPPRQGCHAVTAFMLLLANTLSDCESYVLYTVADKQKRQAV